MRKALLVGINQYSAPYALQGCVNDVMAMRSLLRDYLGFPASGILILKDKQATTRNILNGLRWLANINAGGIALFHYSGHGAQVLTSDPGEPDGLAECICPVDFNWTPQRMITDKQLVAALALLPSTAATNWLSDSCHAGGLDETDRGAKSLATDKRTLRHMILPPAMAAEVERLRKKKKTKVRTMAKSLKAAELAVGFMAACRANQTASDTYEDGRWCGAFTWAFLKAVKANTRAALTDLCATTRSTLSKARYSQAPQVEGTRIDKPFLSW